ncbi:MAG: UDP-3-O-[3-hydroxymyristoyl] glucosamine N-acyltransferase [bacterium]|jgi:UDP-3-O-[3-hydroxymyristoyl] glucosamine N-acyltransferase
MKQMTLQEVTTYLGGELVGDSSAVITGINNIFDAKAGEITFLANPKYADKLPLCQATVVLVSLDVDVEGINLIRLDNPRMAFGKMMALAFPRKKESGNIHPNTFIAESAQIGENVTIYPNVYVGENSKVGNNSTLYPGVYVGDSVVIGENCLIMANCSVMDGSKLGNQVVISPNTVIGSEGYGFERDGDRHFKIPQIGNVTIEDDVEVGTQCAIDRGSINDTIIGKGTKIDNLVHVAHNCEIGENNLLLAQTAVAGTVKTGNNVYFGGRSAAMDHIHIAARTMVGPGAVVTGDVKEAETLFGYPARPYKEWTKASAMFYKTDEQRKKMITMEKKIMSLDGELRGKMEMLEKKEQK